MKMEEEEGKREKKETSTPTAKPRREIGKKKNKKLSHLAIDPSIRPSEQPRLKVEPEASQL